MHPVTIAAFSSWAVIVVLAFFASDLSTNAGIMSQGWVTAGMLLGFVQVGVVVAGFWYLPYQLPQLVRRLLQLFMMSTSMWGVGTLTRALYALS